MLRGTREKLRKVSKRLWIPVLEVRFGFLGKPYFMEVSSEIGEELVWMQACVYDPAIQVTVLVRREVFRLNTLFLPQPIGKHLAL